ncbi:MAG: hypothetical protein ACOCXZ_00170 [Chloroflexota bacterium]
MTLFRRLSMMTLTAMLLTGAVMSLAAVNIAPDQQPTTSPLELTATAIVGAATQTAADGPTQTPSVGTATPLAGLCNSLTYRELDDVADAVAEALMPLGTDDNPLPVLAVSVNALEQTEDCITFQARETAVQIDIATLTISQEDALGDRIGGMLAALAGSPLEDLPDVTLTVTFIQGNQQRTLSVPFAPAVALIAQPAAQAADPDTDGADLLDALTWLDDQP